KKASRGFGIEQAIRLFHRRWSVPVVSRLYQDGALRFSELASWLEGAGRDTLTETLRDLEANGVVERGGDGRQAPYRLTQLGRTLGEACVAAVDVVRAAPPGVLPVVLKKCPMLVLVGIGRGHHRFNAVKAALPGVTSGAL